jgi:hypothetical protein
MLGGDWLSMGSQKCAMGAHVSVEYKKSNVNANVPQSYKGHENLGTWCNTQRNVNPQKEENDQ